MPLSDRIKTLRATAGLSQEKLAEKMGVSRQAVAKWETGRSAPSTDNLFKLAGIFGTTVDLLLEKEAAANIPHKRSRSKAALAAAAVLVAAAVALGLWLHLRPVSADAGACSGGYVTWIFDKYQRELTQKFLTCSDERELMEAVEAVRGSQQASWEERTLFLSFDITYDHRDLGSVTQRLSFVGERIWVDTYRFGGAVIVG